MTNWTALAAVVDPPIPEELRATVVSVLENLEAAFRPLVSDLPPDVLPWTGPEGDA